MTPAPSPASMAQAKEWREKLCISYRWRNREQARADDIREPCGYCGGCKAAPIVALALDAARRDGAREAVGAIFAWWTNTEARAAEAHAVYQREAHRRGDVRHADSYGDLLEATKEWDRVLVRWVAESIHARAAALEMEAPR